MTGFNSFGIKSGICLLIAPVPVHCFSLTFIIKFFFTIKELICIFYLLSLQLVLCCVAVLKSSPGHRP